MQPLPFGANRKFWPPNEIGTVAVELMPPLSAIPAVVVVPVNVAVAIVGDVVVGIVVPVPDTLNGATVVPDTPTTCPAEKPLAVVVLAVIWVADPPEAEATPVVPFTVIVVPSGFNAPRADVVAIGKLDAGTVEMPPNEPELLICI